MHLRTLVCVAVRACVCAWLLARVATWEPPPRAPQCSSQQQQDCKFVTGGGSGRLNYNINGITIIIEYSEGMRFTLNCNRGDVLASPALPAFNEPLRVNEVELSECPLPPGALQDTLRRLNVTLLSDNSTVLRLQKLPADNVTQLAAHHLAGLEVAALEVRAAEGVRLQPEPGFLRPLANLRSLVLEAVALPAAELDALAGLRRLVLRHAGVAHLPPALASSGLLSLHVETEGAFDAAELPPQLQKLRLSSDNTTLRVTASPELSELELAGWVEPALFQCLSCGNLRKLTVAGAALGRLAGGGWLAHCPRLESLWLQGSEQLRVLPPGLLRGAGALARLRVAHAALEDRLSSELLDDTPNLTSLNLYKNNITRLQRGTFAKCRKLVELDLSHNALDESSLQVLAPLTSLTLLDLSYNTRIYNTCATPDGVSALNGCKRLQSLKLSYTGVSHICKDWRQHMKSLKELNLSHTKISELWFHELPSTGDRTVENPKVVLKGIRLKLVGMTRDYFSELSLNTTKPIPVELEQLELLACDCYMYWTRRALPRLEKWVGALACAGDQKLAELAPEDMLCASPDECEPFQPPLPATCACAWRPHARAGERAVRVRCENTGLERVPAPARDRRPQDAPGLRRRYELQLRNNSIRDLTLADLYDDIEGLDLRDNLVRRADARLGRMPGFLRLAGNPLDCSCEAAPLLALLLNRTGSSDLADMTCAGGGRVDQVDLAACRQAAPLPTLLTAGLAAALAVLLALAILVVVALASPSRRFFVKAVLLRWGCLWRAAEPAEDAERSYDAFVTFAHEDSAAAAEVVRRLEPVYRLCVHHRDWVVGLPIAQQIAESVARSRRTVALVSQHYQHSTWTRAEFEQAHAAALRDSAHRLVVVLLEEPAALQLDAQLRRYLQTNTYVRWGDPWFWHKLRVAMPPPRAHRPPPEPEWRPTKPPPAKRPRELDGATELAAVLVGDKHVPVSDTPAEVRLAVETVEPAEARSTTANPPDVILSSASDAPVVVSLRPAELASDVTMPQPECQLSPASASHGARGQGWGAPALMPAPHMSHQLAVAT